MHFLISLALLALASGAPLNNSESANDLESVELLMSANETYKPTEAILLLADYPVPEVVSDEHKEEPKESLNMDESEYQTNGLIPTLPVITLVTSTPLPTDEPLEERPMSQQTAIINAGKHLSEVITAKIVGPIVIFNSKVAAAAGALPPMFAAKGAILGSAIATPIEIGAVVGSSIVSGVTGKLVGIPISIAAGAAAKFVGAAEKGRHIWNFDIKNGKEIFKDGVIKLGHIVFKPIAVIVGAQTALNGLGLGIAGTGIKNVGVGMEAMGAKIAGTGILAKEVGHRLIVSQFPPYLKNK